MNISRTSMQTYKPSINPIFQLKNTVAIAKPIHSEETSNIQTIETTDQVILSVNNPGSHQKITLEIPKDSSLSFIQLQKIRNALQPGTPEINVSEKDPIPFLTQKAMDIYQGKNPSTDSLYIDKIA